MTAPNMATITASLERSLQKCSLNHERSRRSHSSSSRGGGEAEEGITERRSSSSTSDDINNLPNTVSDTSLELNSHISLPYHWEQCLDLKTGEIYYINWRSGMKAKEDPRLAAEYSGGFYSEEEEDDNDSSCDSEESSSESSPCSSRERAHYNSSSNNNNSNSSNHQHRLEKDKGNVLVVAGCKSCLMYFMVPKQVEDCPKCNGQLLHFDRSKSRSP